MICCFLSLARLGLTTHSRFAVAPSAVLPKCVPLGRGDLAPQKGGRSQRRQHPAGSSNSKHLLHYGLRGGGGSRQAGIIPLKGCRPRYCLRFPAPGGPAPACRLLSILPARVSASCAGLGGGWRYRRTHRTTTIATARAGEPCLPPLLIGTGTGGREMLPLLLISTLPAFTLLLVAPATKACCKLARELGLLALLLATELLRHATATAAGSKERERGARMPSKPTPALVAPLAPQAEADGFPLLDLPELALDRVLEELSPASLAAMACVCAALRDRCSADTLWGRHLRHKWGHVLGAAARKEWEAELGGGGARASASAPRPARRRSWLDSLACAWPFSSWIGCRWLKEDHTPAPAAAAAAEPTPVPAAPPTDTVAAWYRALECGEFWLPAQVYNREDGHVGFVLSCYDAHLRYHRRTDTFTARYPPHGRKPAKEEDGVQWNRVRAPPVSTPAHDLHASDCLEELRPGDHFEIQWRKNKDFPYGWWYGVVGHQESCNGNEHMCRCHLEDMVVLEFQHYAPGSRWRQTIVSRKDHREKGDETDGFYGGIRKLQTKDEISTWRQFWPVDVLN